MSEANRRCSSAGRADRESAGGCARRGAGYQVEEDGETVFELEVAPDDWAK